MKSWLSDRLRGVKARAALSWLLLAAVARAEAPPPPPAAERVVPESLVLPSTKAAEPAPEADAIKVRIGGEYEARQSFLTDLPLAGGSLGQTSRLFHFLRLRGLALWGAHVTLRAEIDAPRGMIYGSEPERITGSGSDLERLQPLRLQPRALLAALRADAGEITLGHGTTHLGLGLLDNDGDERRFFGTPDRVPTFERLSLRSGGPDAAVRVGVDGELLFDDGRLSLVEGDQLYRVGLFAHFSPTRAASIALLTRYQALRPRGGRGGAELVDFDLSGSVRQRLRGRSAELFCDYEGVYRVGSVSEPSAYALGAEQKLAALGLGARAGVALERHDERQRYAHFVVSLGWGMATGDADPSDDELHRFVMSPNHAVGSILFSEALRFKTARAEALLDAARGGGSARIEALGTRGGVAGVSYLNPVVLVRPMADLRLTFGGVVATATTPVVDPAALATRGVRRNFDGGTPRGRSLGSELDVGAELAVALEPPMQARFTVEGALAFPGSAFDDADGRGLGTQALTSVGLGLTF